MLHIHKVRVRQDTRHHPDIAIPTSYQEGSQLVLRSTTVTLWSVMSVHANTCTSCDRSNLKAQAPLPHSQATSMNTFCSKTESRMDFRSHTYQQWSASVPPSPNIHMHTHLSHFGHRIDILFLLLLLFFQLALFLQLSPPLLCLCYCCEGKGS